MRWIDVGPCLPFFFQCVYYVRRVGLGEKDIHDCRFDGILEAFWHHCIGIREYSGDWGEAFLFLAFRTPRQRGNYFFYFFFNERGWEEMCGFREVG